MSIEPRRVLVVGDLHASWTWVQQRLLPHVDRTRPDLILQLGDFGFWPRQHWGRKWVDLWERELAKRDLPLWWVDGNHEDHDTLDSLVIDGDTGRRPLSEHVQHLPRGHRWRWGGTDWLAVGGAVSLDVEYRTQGRTWFVQEELSDADADQIIAAGAADVVVSHDAPAGGKRWADVTAEFRPAVRRWRCPDEVLARADAHGRRLRRILDATQPTAWFHGHRHVRLDDRIEATRVIGLACDDMDVTDVALLVGPDGRERPADPLTPDG